VSRNTRNHDHKRTGRWSRRGFLGGAGALMALPLLESLPGRWSKVNVVRANDGQPGIGPNGKPQRLVFWYVPNGIHMAAWTPEAVGTNWALTPILQPLAGLKDKLTVLSGIDNKPGIPEGPGDHAAGTGAFLTCRHVRKTEGDDIKNGVSVDQVAASVIGGETRFPSLQLGLEGGAQVGGCDSGYSCAYIRNISWAGEATPLPKMVNPRLVFDRLFGGNDAGATKEQIDRRRRHRRSVLDYVRAEANSLSTQLQSSDRAKLDEYLTSVREVELTIEAAASAPKCDAPGYPAAELTLTEHSHIMSDLMVAALRCDMTRVLSFMFGNGVTGRSYGFLGVTGGHHDISHHQNREENFEALTVIGTYEIQMLGYFLDKLDAVDDGDGTTLLDNTLVYFSSEIEDGNSHGHENMPILTAGSLAGAMRTGEHIEADAPLANYFMRVLEEVGAPQETFGDDGTEALAGVTVA